MDIFNEKQRLIQIKRRQAELRKAQQVTRLTELNALSLQSELREENHPTGATNTE